LNLTTWVVTLNVSLFKDCNNTILMAGD